MHRFRAAITGFLLGGLGTLVPTAIGAVDDPPSPAPTSPSRPPPDIEPRRAPAEPVYPTPTVKPAAPAPVIAPPPPPAPVVPAAPASPSASIPGLSPETFNVPPGRYFPEGTFLVRRTGTIRALKTGDVVFIPDVPARRDPRRRGERPMVLLPSQTLSALQSAIGTSPDGDKTRVEISGQLFVYRDRQQLLPTIFTVIQSAPKPAVEPGAGVQPEKAVTPDAEEAPSVRAGDDPEIAEMISQLESRRSESNPSVAAGVPEAKTDGTAGAEPEKGGAARPLVPEGTLLTDRRGRLVRIGNQLAIAFDGDAANSAEPAMLILRTRALERLEAAVTNKSESVEIIVSGRVYAYKNQNYVLPVLAQLESHGQLRPLQ